MKCIFSYIPEEKHHRGKFDGKKISQHYDLKYIVIDSVFGADSKYEIFLKMNEDYSVQNPSNITQLCQKSAIENSLLRDWLSGAHSFSFLKVAT